MKRLAIAFASLFLLTIASFPQSKPTENQCRLSLSEAPEVRGFRLGMSMEQATSRFPALETTADEFRFADLTVVFARETKQDVHQGFSGFYIIREGLFPGFADVRSFRLEFLDDRLTAISITYDGGDIPHA